MFKIKKVEIKDRDEKEVYLTRWWLLGTRSSRWALMLHKMHKPDNDACHHDHPWSFITFVLKGGYVEEVTEPCECEGSPHKTHVCISRNGPGTILYRPAEHTHRIDSLPKGVCWTLVLRFKKRRHWGFHTPSGWIPWRDFIELRGGINWCGNWVRERLK